MTTTIVVAFDVTSLSTPNALFLNQQPCKIPSSNSTVLSFKAESLELKGRIVDLTACGTCQTSWHQDWLMICVMIWAWGFEGDRSLINTANRSKCEAGNCQRT